MKCPNCANEMTDGDVFCGVCGHKVEPQSAAPTEAAAPVQKPTAAAAPVAPNPTPAPAAAPQSVPAQEAAPTAIPEPAAMETGSAEVPGNAILALVVKNKVIIIGAVILAILIFLVVNACSGGSNYQKDVIEFLYDGDSTQILVNNKLLKDTIDGDVSSTYSNYAGDCCTAIADDGTLYYVSGKKLEKVADDVSSVRISTDGDIVVYVNDDNELYRYNGSKSKKLADDVSTSDYAISPNGKTIGFTLLDGGVSIFKGTKVKEVDSDDEMYCVAVSDSAKYVYAADDSYDFYVYKNGKEDKKEKLGSDLSGSYFLFNEEITQVIFKTDKGAYFSKNGKEKVKIADGSCSPVYSAFDGLSSYTGFDYKVLMEKNLLNRIYYSYDSDSDSYECDICMIDKKGESEKLASNVSNCIISADMKTMVYEKNGNLYLMKVSNPDSAEKIAKDISGFAMTSDAKLTYYIDEDDTLHSVKKSGKDREIKDDIYSITVSHDDIAFFVDDDDTLYSCDNGKKADEVADEVAAVVTYPNETICLANADYDEDTYEGTYDILIAKRGDKFKEIATDMTIS